MPRHRATTFGLSLVLAAAGLVACTSESSTAGSQESNSTTAIDRFLIGKATAYSPDETLRDRFPTLQASQAERRKTAWSILQKVIEPVAVDETGQSMPRFQTWYGKDEVVPMFEHILAGQTDEERKAHKVPSQAEIDDAFAFIAKRAPTLPTFSAERLAQRRAEIAQAGTSGLGGNEKVLMSPALVGHLLTHYDAMVRCLGTVPAADDAPPNDTNFAPCVGEEFPIDAAIVKASWLPNTGPIGVADTTAAGLTSALTAGIWPERTRTASPGPEAIYTIAPVDGGFGSRLVALHVITKELRDWMWLSMFWSDAPDADFGADRPAAITGPWTGYKMCAVVDFDEADKGEGDAALDPTLAAAHAATRAFGTQTWCSNPYLEDGPHNATTNCIGCHQHAGSTSSTDAILASFPDGSRAKIRKNFPADYTFVTTGNLDLAQKMRTKLEQFVPPAPIAVNAANAAK